MGSDRVGYNGVELDQGVYEKISDFRKVYPAMPIQVDIGVNMETAPLLIKAGATALVSGSTLFGSENIGEAIEKFKNL